MKRLLLLLILLPIIGNAQETGIKWTTGLSWEQIKQKAKQESKYIFLDVYATWCGPCKAMDKSVYTNDTVGNYFNDKFISVKVQTDKTRKDDDYVKSWYDAASSIQKEYRIEAYPSFVFLTPEGAPIHQATGYKGVDSLVAMGRIATNPKKVFEDRYAEYDKLVKDYKKGIKHYNRIVYMIQTAYKFDTSLASILIKDYSGHVSGLNSENRYTKENIEFWALFQLSSSSKYFRFFFDDGAIIDKVMKVKGYAAQIVDKTIFNEIILPFFDEQNKNPSIMMTGMYMGGAGSKPDYSEADWEQLTKIIKQKYKQSIAKRNVLAARIEWYNRHRNADGRVKYGLIQYKKYPPAVKNEKKVMNALAWGAFMEVTDKRLLKKVIGNTKTLVDKYPQNYELLDTYANLLYKIGRREEAIIWQEKAVRISKEPFYSAFQKVLDRMKKGEPTYGVELLK